MLIRIVVLLLLCLSSGMCATLGHYQTQAEEEEAPAVDTTTVEALEQEPTVALEQETTVALEQEPTVALEQETTVALEQETTVALEQETTVADAPVTVEAPVADSPETIVADELVAEIPAAEPEADGPIADVAVAEEPGTETDDMRGDISAPDVMEALTGEALAQEAPDEDKGDDSRAVQTDQSLGRPLTQEEDSSWSLSSVRDSFQTVNGYFDSLVELVGGRNGVCQYRCRYGKTPQPRPGYQTPEPNGCSSFLMGFQFDLGIPAMTECCDQLDVCYDTCGTSKYHCDGNFRRCVHGICSDLKRSLGFVSKVQACESMADAIYNTVWTLGCRPYMNSQRAACLCEEEEKDEL